jgi:hypothetical protein
MSKLKLLSEHCRIARRVLAGLWKDRQSASGVASLAYGPDVGHGCQRQETVRVPQRCSRLQAHTTSSPGGPFMRRLQAARHAMNSALNGRSCSTAALTIAIATTATAWDGAVEGRISMIEITHGANFAFRVWLDGRPLCTGGPAWAYLNEADSNYKVYVAALLMAKNSGQSVVLYTNKEGGFCRIGHVLLR